MGYIFLDESGDLGFDFEKKKTSKYFIITFLFSKNKKILESIVKKIFKGFTKTELRSHAGILHAFKEQPKTRQKLLRMFSEKMAGDVIVITLNKKKVYTNLRDEKQILYNYVANILLDRVFTKKLIPPGETVEIIASRRETNKFLNANFKNYIENKTMSKHRSKIKIEIKSHASEKSLQIVDMLSWSIFRKYEYRDENYYRIFSNRIIEENPLYK